MDWYYATNGQQQGPVTRERLIELHREGQVKPTDLVWNDTMTDWAPFSSVSELSSTPPTAEAPIAGQPTGGGVPAEETPPADSHAPLPSSPAETSPALAAAPAAASGEKVPTYLWQSIVCLVLCCLPAAIPAIIFATKVDPALKQGDVAAAREASQKAKMWCWISFGIGLVVNLVVFAISFFGALAEEM